MPLNPLFFDGRWQPADEARVNPLDRGYLFGDGVYDVIPCYQSNPFRLGDHLQRLETNLEALAIDNPFSYSQWQQLAVKALQDHPVADYYIYIQVTRGVQNPRDFNPGNDLPQVLVYAEKMPPSIPFGDGIKALLLEDRRWQNCHLKTINLLGSVMARQAAMRKGCQDVVYTRCGYLSEATSSNVFAVVGGKVITPPLSPALLPGISRKVCLELLANSRWEAAERAIPADEIGLVEALWLTSSARELVAVSALDGAEMPCDHPAFCYLYERFQEYKKEFV